MPADLDQMFAALRSDADAVPLAEPEVPRRRGERRKRTRIGAAALATACLVAAVIGGGAWLGRGHERPEPAQPPKHTAPVGRPVDFSPLEQVGPGVGFGAPVLLALSATIGDRAYLAWQQNDGLLKVAALDVTTGRPAWSPRTLGKYGMSGKLLALPQAALLVGYPDDGRATLDHTLFVLDPATGALRWQREFDIDGGDLVFFDTILVLAGRGGTVALDWRTGAEVWSAPASADPVVSSFGMRTPADLGGPGGPRGDGFGPTYRDGRLLQVTAAGNLLVSDAQTGRRLAEPRPVAAPVAPDGASDEILAYDGKLFVAGRSESPYRVRMTDLATADEPRVVYTAPAADRAVVTLAPCGPGRICLVEAGRRADDAAVVAVDVATAEAAWRASAVQVERLAPAGDRVLVGGGGNPGLFDPHGQQLLSLPPVQPSVLSWTVAGWVNSASLLLLEGAGPGEVEVFGVDAATGRRTPLGQVQARTTGCSWTEQYLVCPGQQGFAVWRFATG